MLITLAVETVQNLEIFMIISLDRSLFESKLLSDDLGLKFVDFFFIYGGSCVYWGEAVN